MGKGAGGVGLWVWVHCEICPERLRGFILILSLHLATTPFHIRPICQHRIFHRWRRAPSDDALLFRPAYINTTTAEAVVCPNICQFSSEITLDVVLYDLQLNFVQNKSLSGYAQLARFKTSDDVPLRSRRLVIKILSGESWLNGETVKPISVMWFYHIYIRRGRL